jgi:hypothetical protein
VGNKETKLGFVPVTLLLVALIFGVATFAAYTQNPEQFRNLVSQEIPSFFKTVDQKLQTIKTPKAPIGNLTPARDLKGTWTSSLKGKGIQLYGQFATGPGTTKIYENGDVELIINRMEGNTASGTIRYFNLTTSGGTTVPGYGTISVPKQYNQDTGARPIQIRVSSSHLDFGTVKTAEATFSMQGNFTTDIISGTMTMTSTVGALKGEFHLIRVK